MPTHRKYEVQYTSSSNFLVPIEYNIHDTNIVKGFFLDDNILHLILSDGKKILIPGDDISTDLECPDDPFGDLWKYFKLVDVEGDTEDEGEHDD
jgi:hypothetical protein